MDEPCTVFNQTLLFSRYYSLFYCHLPLPALSSTLLSSTQLKERKRKDHYYSSKKTKQRVIINILDDEILLLSSYYFVGGDDALFSLWRRSANNFHIRRHRRRYHEMKMGVTTAAQVTITRMECNLCIIITSHYIPLVVWLMVAFLPTWQMHLQKKKKKKKTKTLVVVALSIISAANSS